jgi:hypothetical protein
LRRRLYNRMRVEELEQLDLAYAPPFATVWNPVLNCGAAVVEAAIVNQARSSTGSAERPQSTTRPALCFRLDGQAAARSRDQGLTLFWNPIYYSRLFKGVTVRASGASGLRI